MNDKDITNDIKLRELRSDDENIINEFFDSMGGESRSLFNRRDYNRRGALKQCAKPLPDRKYWIAELDGKMAAYVFFLAWDTSIPELGIAVRDELQGMHIGKHLMSFALQTAKDSGKGGIQLTTHVANLRAQALYEDMGFVCKGLYKNGMELFYLLSFREENL